MNIIKICGRYTFTFFTLVLVFAPNFASGVEPVRLFNAEKYVLNPNVEILEDKTNSLTICDVVQARYSEDFVSNEGDITNFGLTPYTYWIRFRLSYQGSLINDDQVKSWYLELDRSVIDVAELYISTGNDDFDIIKSDLRMTFPERDFSYVTSVFPINMHSGDDTEFYIRVENSSTFVFSLVLWEPREFLIKVVKDELFYGIYFGVLLCLLVYNFFVWLSVKETSYLYYVGYLFSVTWFQLLEVGHGVIQSGWFFELFGKEFIALSIWVTTGFIIQFFRYFLITYEKYPVADRFLKVLLWIVFASILISPLMRDLESLFWASIFSVVFLSTLLLMSLYFFQRGDKDARFFFFAWIFNVTGFLVYSMMANGVLPANMITLHAGEMGVVFESSLLAFALAERIKRSRAYVLLSNQRALEISQQYQSIFSNSLEGKYEMDLYGVVKAVNPAAAKIMGFSSVTDFMEKRVQAVRHMFNVDQFSELVRSGMHRCELYFEPNDGICIGPRWALHKARLILDDRGNPIYIEGSIFDITDEKERGFAIRQEVIERAKKQIALDRSQEKSDLLSVMSYCIRTPLSSIVGFSEELKDENVSNFNRKYCTDTIVENSRILLRLINDILDYSKIEAGKFDVEKIPIDILRIFEEVHLDYKEKAASKKLSFDVIFDYPFPKMILGDSTRIKQVLVNLCENAIKFTNRGSILLSIGFVGETVVFTVSDTGCGIAGENSKALFDEKTLISNGKFGLVISKNLADKMGGKINVISRNGKGSIFELIIPADGAEEWVKGDGDNKKTKENGRYKNTLIVPNLKGSILLAEDNIVNQKLVSKVLEKTGLTVTVVSDGVQVCDYCDDTRPDFILMDINMPLRDGLAATKYLRGRGHKMPIYALTAETDEVEIKRALDAGCDGFLQKPLDKPLLYKVLMQYFDKKT